MPHRRIPDIGERRLWVNLRRVNFSGYASSACSACQARLQNLHIDSAF